MVYLEPLNVVASTDHEKYKRKGKREKKVTNTRIKENPLRGMDAGG